MSFMSLLCSKLTQIVVESICSMYMRALVREKHVWSIIRKYILNFACYIVWWMRESESFLTFILIELFIKNVSWMFSIVIIAHTYLRPSKKIKKRFNCWRAKREICDIVWYKKATITTQIYVYDLKMTNCAD